MDLFQMRDFDAHEQVVFGCDAASGLRAIIAIHSTILGPAAGGCRMWPYAASSDALVDALRLSRGMSYKNAMAELPFGGGKAVIIGDPREKTRQRMEAFGRLVDSLGGRYITAEDVGTTTTDMGQVARVTPFVSGLPRESEVRLRAALLSVETRGRRRRSVYSSASKLPCGFASAARVWKG